MASDRDTEFIKKNHPVDAPKFKYDHKQAFKVDVHPETGEYWYITSRLWNYDADTDDALVAARAYKQYVIASVSSLGADEKVVTEDVLVQHYETVDMETAKQALDLNDDEDGREEPTRSEPADFGHGDSTGVQDL